MATQKTSESKSASGRSSASAKKTTKTAASKTAASKTASAAKSSGGKSAAPKSSPKAASSAKSTAARRSPPKGQERVQGFDGKSSNQPIAIAFLMRQHRDVEKLFEAYERAPGDEEKTELSRQICLMLKVHTQIEEELLYPDAHEKLDDEDLVDEAIVEHQGAKDLIAQIESMQVGEHLYDAKVKVLSEYVKHHVREEETEMFPEARKSDMDLQAIGERLQARSDELIAQLGGESEGSRGGRGLFAGAEQRP